MQKIYIAGGILLVLVVSLVILGAFLAVGSISSRVNAQEPTQTAVAAVEQVAANQPITITKIISTPVVYKDLHLSVDGQVVGWVTKNAIIVSEVGEKDRKKYLLVIRDQNFGLPSEVPVSDVALGETLNVSISGTVGILNIPAGATGYGDEDSVRQLQKWNKKPVIFANSVLQK